VQPEQLFLLSREPRPGFQWSDLVGRTVLSFAEAPTPWQCMLTVLRRHGVDPRAVRIERERPAPDAVAAFRAGHGDFLEQPQPVVERLLAEGAAHLVASMGEATGPVPFSSYMTTPAFLAREPDVVRATRAVYRTQRWLAGHGAAPIAAAIAPAFRRQAGDPERAVARYRGRAGARSVLRRGLLPGGSSDRRPIRGGRATRISPTSRDGRWRSSRRAG
jgi:NitT/TauT family transport system substrate-binding protein